MMRHGRPHTPEQADDHDDLARDSTALGWLAVAIMLGAIALIWWWRS